LLPGLLSFYLGYWGEREAESAHPELLSGGGHFWYSARYLVGKTFWVLHLRSLQSVIFAGLSAY